MAESAEPEIGEEPSPKLYRLKSGRVPFMLRLKSWWQGLELKEREAPELPPEPEPKRPAPLGQDTIERLKQPWQPERIAMAQAIWGQGFLTPGGPEYVEYMVKPLGLTNESVVLDIGAALGGPARLMAKEFNAWITGLESDAGLAEQAMAMSTQAGLAKKAPIEHFDRTHVPIDEAKYHCIFSKEALFRIENKEELVPRIKSGLKPRGQLLFSDFVVSKPGASNDALTAWAEVHHPTPEFWAKEDYVSCLAALKLDVRVDEDITDRLRSEILHGCAKFVDSAAQAELTRLDKVALASELEYWARCVAAIDSGVLRVCRIHCISH